MARAGELPHTPYYGSVDSTPLWLILLGATFDWTGDRGLVDRLVAERARGARLDRHVRRPRRRRVRRVRAPLRARPVNQGWKDSSDAIRDRERARRRCRRSRWPRSRATSSTPSAGWPGSPGCAARTTLATRLEAEADDAARRGSRRRSGSRTCATTRWPSTATSGRPTRSARTPASACGPASSRPERARDVVDRLLRPGDVLRLGDPDVRGRPAGLQPDRLPHGHGLAARHVAHRGRAASATASTTPRTGWPARCWRPPSASPTTGCPSCSAASIAATRTSPVPYPVACSPQAWAAGASFLFLETMLGLRAHAERGELELWHPHLPDWLGKVTLTDLRVGDASVDLLFHRWRGTTSAEVLRKVGDVAVTVRL